MARFLKIGGIVFAGVVASAAAPAFAGAQHAGGGFGGHMVVHPRMVGHGGVVYNRPPNTFPQGYGYAYAPPRGRQGYDYGYALPHGRPGYDYGYALPYGGARGWGTGVAFGGGGYYYDPGYGAYDAGTAQGAIIILPTTAIYGPTYPLGYYGASYTPTGNGVIYNLPAAPLREPAKIIYLGDHHDRAEAVRHMTVIRGGVVSEE